MYDLTSEGVYPADVYSHPEWHCHDIEHDAASFAIVASVHGRPNASVAIYRSVPAGIDTFHHGDWVTPNEEYAIQHGRHPEDSALDLPVIRLLTLARYLITDGNSLSEWGYVGPTRRANSRPL